MNKETLQIEDFPIPKALDPNSELEEGWVDTLPGTGLQPKKLVALDCEMVNIYIFHGEIIFVITKLLYSVKQ
jgi:hypothetical protein